MYSTLYVQYPLCLSDFNETLNLLGRLWQNNEISNFMKICGVVAELFHAGVDRHKANSRVFAILRTRLMSCQRLISRVLLGFCKETFC